MKITSLTYLPFLSLTLINADTLPNYDPTSWNSQCKPLAFRSSRTDWDGKWSDLNEIGVSGGGWNKVHLELTSRPLNDGEKFEIIGNKQQVGVGLCIDSCDIETKAGIRWNYNCVGFYGDGTSMLATDSSGTEYQISVDRYRSNQQGFTYDQENNCVTHIGSRGKQCTKLPDHFEGKAVRAIGQVWNSAYANIASSGNGLRGYRSRVEYNTPANSPSYNPSSWNSQCKPLAFRSSNNDWDGKWSDLNEIGVSGGGWNKVHLELTSRPLNDGEKFEIIGNKQQVGVGLCIDSCDIETKAGIRWNYNCVGFYGDGTSMLATDSSGTEYQISVDRYRSNQQGFTYDQENNCVTHIGSRGKQCTKLPDHFEGKAVRAIGQVWNSAFANLVSS